MARPRGEVRQALAEAVARLALERGPVSCREVAEAAQVGYGLARETIKNMERAGEVVAVGKHKPPGVRWHSLYEPAVLDELPQPWGGIEALADVVKDWVAPVP